MATVLTLNIIGNLFWVSVAMNGLKDLDSFIHSGLAFSQGLNPYGYHPHLPVPPIIEQSLNLNPPISLYFFEALSHLDQDTARIVFILGSVALVTPAVGLLLYEYPEKRSILVVLAVMAMAGIWHMLFYLQIYAPLVLAIVGAWLAMKRGNLLLASVLIGLLIAVKPNYALVGIVLLAAGHVRVAMAAGIVAAAISLVPLVLEGPLIYWRWLELGMQFEGFAWTSNASLMSVGAYFGSPTAGRVAAVAMVLGVLAFQWRHRPNVMDSTAIGLLVVLLFGPVSWAGYTLLLLPFLFSRPWNAPMWVAILLLVTPSSPHRVSQTAGNVLPSMDVQPPSLDVSLPAVLTVPWDAVVSPALSAMYAWAVLLLLAVLLLSLSRGMDSKRPRFPWEAPSLPLPQEALIPQPAPVPGAAPAYDPEDAAVRAMGHFGTRSSRRLAGYE